MNCLVCQKNLDEFTPFCSDHAPAWGKCLRINGMAIFPGELSVISAIVAKFILRQKLVRWWLGSDVFILLTFPPGRGKLSLLRYRFKHFVTKRLVDANWFDSKRLLIEYTEKFKCRNPQEKHHILNMLTEKVSKRKHEGINIAYYWPKKSNQYYEYLYGIDLIEKLILLYPEAHWLRLNGALKPQVEMKMFLPIVDAYIRPSRHDGGSRLVRECRLNDIPVYWSEDGKPTLKEICKFVETIISAKPSL